MAWVPIQESGVAFTFFAQETVLQNSVATLSDSTFSSWNIEDFVQPVTIRVTVLSYLAFSEFGPGLPASFGWGETGGQANQTEDGTAFTPSPILMTLTQQDIDNSEFVSYNGSTGSEFSVNETYQFLIEVEVAEPVPPEPCEELGRVTRAYVSGYTRSRVHQSVLYAAEKRCLVANFNGAVPVSRSIAEVKWQTQNNSVVVMSNAAISGKEGQVTIEAQLCGWASIRCTATLDNGERYTQLFQVDVRPQPYYDGDTFDTGPTILVATAP